MKSLDERFESLAHVARDLNAASDEISSQLRHVEERLKLLGLGVQVELEYPLHIDNFVGKEPETDPGDDEPLRSWTGDLHRLAYKKIAGTWRLVVRKYQCRWLLGPWEHPEDCEEGPDESTFADERALLDCSREIRLAAAPQLDRLLAAIHDEAAAQVGRVKQALDGETRKPSPRTVKDTGAASGQTLIGISEHNRGLRIKLHRAQGRLGSQIEGDFDLIDAGDGTYSKYLADHVGKSFVNAAELIDAIRAVGGDAKDCRRILNRNKLRIA